MEDNSIAERKVMEMAVPEGYSKLAIVGIAWKREYSGGITYHDRNAVYYNGCSYVALKDNPTGPPSDDGVNWSLMAKGLDADPFEQDGEIDEESE